MQKKTGKKATRDIGSELSRIALPLILTAAAIFTLLSLTVLFKIDTVIITGASDYTTEEILTACEIQGGENLIRTSMTKCAENIESRLIYIEKAELKRKFPSTLEISITPAVETVSAEYDGKFCLLSAGGKILDITDEPVPETIIIYGAQPQRVLEDWEIEAAQTTVSSAEATEASGSETTAAEEENDIPAPVIGEKFACADEYRTEIFYLLLKTAASSFSEKTNHYDMTDYINISCLYDNRIKIVFGSTAEFDYKIKLAENIITTKLSDETEGTLTMLDRGASFIDKDGLAYNDEVYHHNINPSAAEETSDETASTDETVSSAVNFE
ncbi:MAG: FtsQ-type POTRA domain-containing protein [Oscillospiraceae bacterium]|nr:FtsQ-type POTRA domain-containing protein [Oscillospiraceae bacterium]